MSHRSLTHAEAVARAAPISKLGYELDVDLTGGAEAFRTTTTVRFAADPDASTFLELRPKRLVSVTLNGAELDPQLTEGRLELTGLAAENVAVVTADFAYSHSSEGMHRFVDPADGAVYVYAQPSITDAPCFMACFDQPDLKASVMLSVSADPSWLVVANGEGVQEAPGRWNFAATKPIATYLITLVAGPLVRLEQQHDGIGLGLLARTSYAAILERDAPEIFEITRNCLDRYHELFAVRYPFGKYDQAFVPEFSWGAMEFPGCVVYRDELLFRGAVTETDRLDRAAIIAHEMAHMWFGDLVTMRWWDDLWLNESFATYMGYRLTAEVTRWPQAWTRFGVGHKIAAYAADQRPSTHPVAPAEVRDTDDAFSNFDSISYSKGCSALRQLVAWIGDDAFFAGLRDYFDKHAWGNATLADLLGAFSRASGRDVEAWAELWLRTPQVNTVRMVSGPDGSPAIEQTAVPEYPSLRPHRLGLGWRDGEGRWQRRDIEVAGAITPLSDVDGEDPLLNDGDLTFVKTRMGSQTRTRLAEVLREQEDGLSRAVRWTSAWDAVRDGEWPVDEFLDLVATALPHEPEVTVIEPVFALARQIAVARYLPAQRYESSLSALGVLARGVLDSSAPGSGRQLAGARALLSTTGSADTGWMSGWLSGNGIPEGLLVDDELRWSVLTRLSVLGAASRNEIDAEEQRDHSARGEVEAVRCRASLPDPAEKQRAFDVIVREQDLSNRAVQSAGWGLWQPEQAELTESYVERFFTELPLSAADRSGDLLRQICHSAYPVYAVSQNTLVAAERALAGDLHPMLRRAMVDETDDLRRALRAREVARSA